MNSFWINPLHNSKLADNKIFQQQIAIECGLSTPPTLYSNDPKEIRDFIRSMGGKSVYKPFRPFHANWLSAEGRREYLYTSIIDESSLPNDDVLAITPGIFQKLVAKEFELRVVVMGQKVFTFRIDAPEKSRGQLDWRSAYNEIRLREVSLDQQVEESILAVLQKLGLVAGSFDLIVTPNGSTVFLEINEGGQFLWIEGYTDFPLLDAFCEFLIQHTVDFCWQNTAECLRIDQVSEEAKLRWIRARENSSSPVFTPSERLLSQ